MYRRIWLAHRLAREAAPNAVLEARGRVDHVIASPFDWAKIRKVTDDGKVAIGAIVRLYGMRRDGVPAPYRCIVDDQFAVGPPSGMDGYASVFPDFHDLPRFMLAHRNDNTNHNNERVLTTHLHYRGVRWDDFPLPDSHVHGSR
jgi:hypothetical protein